MALTKIKNISIDPDFRITGTEIADIFTLTSRTVTVNTPSNSTEAANKSYVDNAIAAVNSFSTIAVGGQSNVVADNAAATVTFVEDTGIIITTDANTDEVTFKADATSNNVSNKLVIRDGSGNFSAGVITATSLTGKFTNSRDIQLTGDVTGTVGFDGSQNVQLSTTIADSGVVDDTYGSATQVGQFVVDTRGIITSASNVNIAIDSTQITDWQEAVEDTYSSSILAGTHAGITFTYDDTTGALSSSLDSANKFDKIAVSGQTTVEADTPTDTVTFAGSTGLTITTNAGTDTVTFTNSGVTSAAVSGTGLSINTSTGAVTITSNATPNATADTVVARDSNGDFSAGIITADIIGDVQGDLTGNVTSTGTSSFSNIQVTGGAIDSAIIGGTQPAAITGTTITANTGFTGDLTGNVTGNITSNGTSSFADIDVNGGYIDDTPIGSSTPSTGDFTVITTTGDLNVASGVLFVDTANDMVGINNPTPAEALDVTGNAIVSGNATVGQDLTVTGTLTVLGSTVTVDSTTTTIVDPVLTLGQGTYTSNDGKARGIEFKYYANSAQRTGFFGYDTTDGVYKLLTAAANNSEVFTGTKATLSANIDGFMQTARNIELIDDVTGIVSFNGSQDVQIATTWSNTSVTAGSYGAIDKVATFTVDGKGRLTAAGEQQISIASTQITDFDQAAQDAIGVLIDNGTQTDIVVTYDSVNHELNFSVPGAKSYSNFAVSSQTTVSADAANDTITFAGSTGLDITTDAGTETITFTNSGVTSAAVNGTGLSIDVSTGAVTISSNATDANTGSTIVSRDSNGDFSAGTITADLNGNATSADKWSSSRTVTFTGDVTGSFNIDGSGDVSNVALTIGADTVALGTDTTGDYVEDVTAGSGISITNGTGEGSNPTITNDDKGSDQEIFKSIIVDGQTTVTADSNTEALTLVAGTGVTISTDNTTKEITIENSGLPTFRYVAISGQTTVEADQSDDTLTLVGGTAISISADATTDAITFTNDGVTSFGVSGVGISVNASTGSVTLTSDATPNNTNGTIVSRDANGAFNAGDIGAADISADSLTTVNGVTVGDLTAGRVTFAGTGGLLSDASTLTFNTSTNTLSTTTVSATTVEAGTFKSSGLTAGRVAIIGTSGVIADDNSLTYNATTNTLTVSELSVSNGITATDVTVSNLTAGRVTFAGTAGILSDDGALTFDSGTSTLATTIVEAGDLTLSTNTIASTGDLVLAPAVGGFIDANTNKIINVVDPTSDQHAATKKYVDDAVNGVTNLNIAGDGGTDQIDLTVDTLTIAGTTNQIDTWVANDTVTISLPSTLVAPGSLEVTTTSLFTGDVTASGNVTVTGNLTVNGTTTSVNSTTVDIADKNLTLAKGSANAAAANGAGITIDGASATITYASGTDTFDINKGVNITGDLDVTGNASFAAIDDTPIGQTTAAAGKCTTLASTDLSATRVPFANTNKELVDSANLTFSTSTDTLSTVNISSTTVTTTGDVTVGTLTAGRITFADTGGLLSDSTDLTYNTGTQTLSVPNISVTNFELGNLTAGRVTFAGTNGLLKDDADMTFATSTNTLSVPHVSSTDFTSSALVSGRVLLAGTAGLITDNSALTFSAGTLTATAFAGDLTGNVTGNVTGDLTGNVTGDLTGNVTGDLTGNVTGTVSDISNHSIDDLGDVDLTGLQDQDTLRWDNTSQQWVPSISGGFQMRRARFTANGTSPSFTLNNAPGGREFLIVTVSGIPQAGDTFSVSGTTLTLGGTPLSGEIVEVIDFTTGVFSPAPNSTDDIAEGSTNKYYSDTAVKTMLGNGTMNSNIIPASNNVYDLGSSSSAFKNVYVSGSGTLTFGSIKIVNNSGTLQFLNVADDSYALVDLGLTLDSDISIDGGSY